MADRIVSTKEVKKIYRRWAGNYDLALKFYYVIGFRVQRYRRQAVKSLNLKKGDTILDLGCGTGLNFPILQKYIGSEGTIIGVDLSESMLDKACERVRENHWNNVELIQADISEYTIPSGIDGILSTLAITLPPDYDTIIKTAAETLPAGKRMSIFELKQPDHWPDWLAHFALCANKPFGARLEHTQRTPWLSIEDHFSQSETKEYYWGAAYVATGVA